MIDALKLIISRSPMAAQQAMQCIQAISAKSPMVQNRYNRVVETLFSDPQAKFSQDEQALIAAYVTTSEEEADEARKLDLRVRVNATEKAEIQQAAKQAGQTVSDFIRARIGLVQSV